MRATLTNTSRISDGNDGIESIRCRLEEHEPQPRVEKPRWEEGEVPQRNSSERTEKAIQKNSGENGRRAPGTKNHRPEAQDRRGKNTPKKNQKEEKKAEARSCKEAPKMMCALPMVEEA